MSTNIDTGWAWVVLGVSIFNLLLLGAMSISIGIFQTEYLLHFHGNTALVSLACSMCASLQCLLGPMSSVLVSRYGMRATMMVGSCLLSGALFTTSLVSSLPALVFCYGVVGGFGFGTVYTPSFVLVAHYFEKKRVLANGIALTAAGIGLTTGPHLIGWLIDQSGWRGALVVFSFVTSQMVVTSCLVFPLKRGGNKISLPHSKNENVKLNETYSTKSKSERNPDALLQSGNKGEYSKKKRFLCLRNMRKMKTLLFIRNYEFWLLMNQICLFMLCYYIHIVHFPSYVLSVGVNSSSVPIVLTAFGVSVTVSRLAGSFIFNRLNMGVIVPYITLLSIYGGVAFIMPFIARDLASLLCYEVLFGLFYGSGYILLNPLVVELFGVEQLSAVVGCLLAVGGLATLVGPPIAGAIYDLTSSYSIAFHIAGLLAVIGTAVLVVIPVRRKKHLQQYQCGENNMRPPEKQTKDLSEYHESQNYLNAHDERHFST